jgi:hypothetical protein
MIYRSLYIKEEELHMKEAIVVDIDGYNVDTVHVPHDTYGVTPIYEPEPIPEPEEDEEEGEGTPEQPEEEEQEPPALILVGYRVAVPFPTGFSAIDTKFRYDVTAWQAAIEAYETALAAYHAALAEYDPESEEPAPQPPATVNLRSFWTEGLTPEEIDAIRNAPRPETDTQKIARLETELSASKINNLDTMDALFDVYLMVLDLQAGGDPA